MKGETNKKKNNLCSSVFKNSTTEDIRKQMTNKWIELINRLEKNKFAI